MRLTLLALCAAAGLTLQESDPRREPALPQVGRPAPAFRLNDAAGEVREIGGPARQWTVLAFYPKAMTPG